MLKPQGVFGDSTFCASQFGDVNIHNIVLPFIILFFLDWPHALNDSGRHIVARKLAKTGLHYL